MTDSDTASRGDREPLLGGGAGSAPLRTSTGFTIWLTGLSGSGKSTIAGLLEQRLRARSLRVEVLDGDVVRAQLSPDLGFTRADREQNIKRIGWICELLSRNDVIAIAAAISPYRAGRDEARARIGRFIEVHLSASLEAVQHRDPKGLYRRASAGEISSFTGVSDVYEAPLAPEVTCPTGGEETPAHSVTRIISAAERLGYLEQGETPA